MAKIDLEKFICSLIEYYPAMPLRFKKALKEQGLEYKDGQIVEINQIEPFEIKAGHWYTCIVASLAFFAKNNVYYCSKDGYLDQWGKCETEKPIFINGDPSKMFRPATEDEIPHEPKFKINDWVVYNEGNISRIGVITRILKKHYIITFDSEIQFPFIWGCKLRNWTIQDAKDGDVLSSGLWTLIFRKIEEGFVYYHCASSSFEEFSTSNTGCFASEQLHPASKEQRDLLFAKMEEAGYEFDFTTKELKKIPDLDNTNGTNTIKFKEEPKEQLTEFEAKLIEVINECSDGMRPSKAQTNIYASSLLSLARKQIEEETSNKHINVKIKKK